MRHTVLPWDIHVIDTIDAAGAAVTLWCNPYCRKRDGKWMLYINSDRNASIGLSEEGLFHQDRLTRQQAEILELWLTVLREAESIPFTGRYDAHKEAKNHLALGVELYQTDNGSVGGQCVATDGWYLTKDGKLFSL